MVKPKFRIRTITEVAEDLKAVERTHYRMAAAEMVPALKNGGTWRFPRVDVDSWIGQQSMGTRNHS